MSGFKAGDWVRHSAAYLDKFPEEGGVTGIVRSVSGSAARRGFPIQTMRSCGHTGNYAEHELELIEEE